ncbi:MAG: hypothetical protein IAF38_09420 [Bacteroidia bacterium]|nr:hypothetical protein [Bacteroidia bacterium]
MKNNFIFFAVIIFSAFSGFGHKKNYTYTGSETTLSFSADPSLKFLSREEVCAVYAPVKGKDSSETELSPFRLSFSVIKNTDAGDEQLLNVEPDGALQFAIKIMEKAKKTGESKLTVNGTERTYYKVSGMEPTVEGKPNKLRVCMVMVLHNKNDNIFVVADCSKAYAATGEKYFIEVLKTLKF